MKPTATEVARPEPLAAESRRTGVVFILWLGIIFLSSTDTAGQWANDLYHWLLGRSPATRSSLLHLLAQKSFHVVLFAVFGLLLASWRGPGRRWGEGVLWSFVVGAVSEGLQFFSSHRSPAAIDVVLNGLSGSVFFWLKIR